MAGQPIVVSISDEEELKEREARTEPCSSEPSIVASKRLGRRLVVSCLPDEILHATTLANQRITNIWRGDWATIADKRHLPRALGKAS